MWRDQDHVQAEVSSREKQDKVVENYRVSNRNRGINHLFMQEENETIFGNREDSYYEQWFLCVVGLISMFERGI